jgi:hypothetical protein
MFVPDPGFKFFHPGSRVKKIADPVSHLRIYVFLTQKTRFSEKWSGMFISDQDFFSFPDLDPGSRGKKSIGSQIRNTAFLSTSCPVTVQ